MKDVAPILRSLGFTESEVKTYLAALEGGPGSVIDLALRTGLSRQSIYEAIESLTNRALMTSVIQGKKKQFAAEPPEKILASVRRREAEVQDRLKDLEEALPELELRVGGEKPVVKLYEGIEGAKAILADIAASDATEICEIADLDAIRRLFSVEENQGAVQPLKRKGTFSRSILAGTPSGKTMDSERYLLPQELGGFKANLTIYGDKIALVAVEGKMHSIIIESPAVAQMLRILHGLAFDSAKKFPPI